MSVQGMFQGSSNGVAVAGITSPAWLPPLTDMSAVAADLLPIVGVLWLVVQIIFYLKTQFDKKDDEE